MKWITPFAFIDDAGALHLCCDRVCEELGMPLTEENLRIAEQALIEQMRKASPDTKIVTNVTRHIAENPNKVAKE